MPEPELKIERYWSDGRPVTFRLPQAYRENPVVDALVLPPDEFLSEQFKLVVELARQYDPMVAPIERLDELATDLPTSIFRDFWDSAWPESWKRSLLSNAAYLNQWRGDLKCARKLCEIFGLEASIVSNNGFRLGVDPLPGTLGSRIMSYQVSIPARYGVATAERNLIDRIFGNSSRNIKGWALQEWMRLSIVLI